MPPELDSAVDRISQSLGSSLIGELSDPVESPGLAQPAVAPVADPSAKAEPSDLGVQAPVVHDLPKSWKQDMRDHWGKLDPSVQAYVMEREKQMADGFGHIKPWRDAVAPHLDYLNAQNIPVHHAIDSLLRAHRMLTEGTIEERRANYRRLGENLKLVEAMAEQQQQNGQPPNLDPKVVELSSRVEQMERMARQEREAAIARIREENYKQVTAFAEDTKAHPYFDEVADQIALLVSQGQSLQEAYDNAVWLNPVTRAKEIARAQTEAEAKLKETARLEALPKKKAKGVNVSSSGDGSEPTEPTGTLEDTVRSTMKKIRERSA